jgi:hypothetical protein
LGLFEEEITLMELLLFWFGIFGGGLFPEEMNLMFPFADCVCWFNNKELPFEFRNEENDC